MPKRASQSLRIYRRQRRRHFTPVHYAETVKICHAFSVLPISPEQILAVCAVDFFDKLYRFRNNLLRLFYCGLKYTKFLASFFFVKFFSAVIFRPAICWSVAAIRQVKPEENARENPADPKHCRTRCHAKQSAGKLLVPNCLAFSHTRC